ncbi:hypothetical protein F4679DRAFT_543260 [Xylaria curta]|nr:hypothetical protein F4679DRAFT_543260 [Xylaria curta]
MRDFEAIIREERKVTVRDEDVQNEWNEPTTTTRGFLAPGEFILLDQTRYDFLPSGPEGDVASEARLTILGCTLFSRVLPAQADDTSVFLQDHTARFEEELAWLNTQVTAIEEQGGNRKVVILTHYSPSLDERAVDPRHRNSRIQAGFATDLSGEVCFRSSMMVGFWVFGHTHFNCDFVHDGLARTRLLTNQRGYYFS